MTVTWSGTYTWSGTPALTWIEDKESRKSTIVRLGRKAPSSYLKSYKVFGTSDDSLLHADCNGYISRNTASPQNAESGLSRPLCTPSWWWRKDAICKSRRGPAGQ
jgi:hypothetical protein